MSNADGADVSVCAYLSTQVIPSISESVIHNVKHVLKCISELCR